MDVVMCLANFSSFKTMHDLVKLISFHEKNENQEENENQEKIKIRRENYNEEENR